MCIEDITLGTSFGFIAFLDPLLGLLYKLIGNIMFSSSVLGVMQNSTDPILPSVPISGMSLKGLGKALSDIVIEKT